MLRQRRSQRRDERKRNDPVQHDAAEHDAAQRHAADWRCPQCNEYGPADEQRQLADASGIDSRRLNDCLGGPF